jgi:hypothetical protein
MTRSQHEHDKSESNVFGGECGKRARAREKRVTETERKAQLETTTDENMIEAFQKNISYLTRRGFKPSFNIIDNVASKAIKNTWTKKI